MGKNNVTEYDGIPIIRKNDLNKLKNALLIVFTVRSWVYGLIKNDLDGLRIAYIHVNEMIGTGANLNGKHVKEQFPNGQYEDQMGNKIYFDSSLSDKLIVLFQEHGNILHIA